MFLGNRLDDGKWHHLEIERRGGEGTILLDGEQHQFNIPGQPTALKVKTFFLKQCLLFLLDLKIVY